MIKLNNVSKVYCSKKKIYTNALDNIDLTLEDKGMTFVIGKTGCGKSTLLNLLGKLDEPTTGDIIVDGDNITKFKDKESDQYRNSYVGFVFQEYNLIDEFTVYENISMVSKLKGDNVDEAEIDSLLKKFDLYKEKHKRCDELSGGQRQRVAIIRAIVKKPKLILADEPTGALDSKTGTEIFKILKELSKQTLVVVVTHDLEYAEQFADRIIEIKDGQVAKDTKPKIKFVPNKNHIGNNQKQGSFKFKDLFRLGMSNLGSRWKRLTLMLVVSVLAFSILGTAATFYSFDEIKMVSQTIHEDDIGYMYISRNYNSGFSSYSLSESDLDSLEQQYERNFYPVYKDLEFSILPYRLNSSYLDQTSFYLNYPYTFEKYYTLEINETIAEDLGSKLLCGRYPESDNEVVVSEFFYMDMKDHGYTSSLGDFIIKRPQDLLGKTVEGQVYKNYSLTKHTFNIVGVLDTQYNEDRYDILKKVGDVTGGIKETSQMTSLSFELKEFFKTSLNGLFFVNPGFYTRNIEISNGKFVKDISGFDLFTNSNYDEHIYEIATRMNSMATLDYADSNYDIIWKNDTPQDTLSENQIILRYTDTDVMSLGHVLSYQNKLLEEHVAERIITLKQEDNSKTEYEYKKLAVEQIFDEIVFEQFGNLYLDIDYSQSTYPIRYTKTLQVVGVCLTQSTGSTITDCFVSNKLYDDISDTFYLGNYDACFTNTTTINKDTKFLSEIMAEDSSLEYSSIYTRDLSWVSEGGGFSIIVRYITLAASVLAIFAGLLFYSYISVIIDDKKKQTGILRSLGANKKDICLLYLTESIFLVLIIVIVSSGLSALLCMIINNIIRIDVGYLFKILTFDIIPILVIFGVSLVIAAVSTAIPVIRLSKLKPIEALKDK